jgi:transposase-like protein
MIEAGRNAVNSQRYTPESKDEAVREVLQRKSHDAGCSYKNQ